MSGSAPRSRPTRAGWVGHSVRSALENPATAPDRLERRLRQIVEPRLFSNPRVQSFVARQFHRMYYYAYARTWHDTRWLGTPVWKCPFDLWVYQELFNAVRPDVILECGTRTGGSAFYYASLCDMLGTGRVITIDVDVMPDRPAHERISYLTGSSVDPGLIAEVRGRIADDERVLVILDSDHRRDHVLNELLSYRDLVSPGSYMVVEDTNLNGHPVQPAHGPGPTEAVREFLRQEQSFERDRYWEKFFVSFNNGGFLKKRPRAVGDGTAAGLSAFDPRRSP